MSDSIPRVFISYSHDSQQHCAVVLDLSNTLRNHGIDVELDRYHVRPEKGWPHWCEEQLRPENSKFVIVVCTDTYRRRVEGKIPADEGRGVFWEGAIVYQYLYDSKGNDRFIPVLLPGATENDIPTLLRGTTRYHLAQFDLSDAGYEVLYRELTGQPLVSKPPLGQIVTLPSYGAGNSLALAPLPRRSAVTEFTLPVQIGRVRLRHGAERLFGREEDLKRLDAAWDDPKTHILTIVAWGGVGKTSLVVEWMARKAADGWPGFEREFEWTFYSQGTREQGAASAELFIAEALKFFGDPDPTQGSSWDRGERLARLVAERKSLLVLDGLEPLQHPPGSTQPGKLKDPALETLLKGLARHNPGLCLVTTRERVDDLKTWHTTATPEWNLDNLTPEAGAAVLYQAGVRRAGAAEIKPEDQELKDASKEVKGHALTLQLLGSYLAGAHRGDIRKRTRVKFDKADERVQGGHAFRVMAAYETWLGQSGAEGARQLAVLRLLGLFDRPADPGCLAALRQPPAIPGLTEPLLSLDEEEWNLAVSGLESAGLVKTAPWEPKRVKGFGKEEARKRTSAAARGYDWPLGDPEDFTPQGLPAWGALALDAHPLLRQYFAKRLRETEAKAWQEGHRRLYEHLKASVPYWPEGAEGLQPLYQSVAHGCLAGMHQQACDDVYYVRILRGAEGFYSTRKLGLFGSDLGAVACFFEQPWSRPAPALSEADQAWLFNAAACGLRTLGRLSEALEPMQAGLQNYTLRQKWQHAAITASNLSALELTLGDVPGAMRDGEQSVEYADRSEDAFQRMGKRTTHADALYQAGRRTEALDLFREAETLQAEWQPHYPLLYSVQGFRYCDLLLAESERAAWRVMLTPSPLMGEGGGEGVTVCREVEQRAAQTLKMAENHHWPLDIALDHLTLGRAALYRAILEHSSLVICHSSLDQAVDGLRAAGTTHHVSRGLLTRAWLQFAESNPAGARADLDEAQQIAERGAMKLHMADIHLHRARLFRDKAALAQARQLIEQCGYGRRKEELEDAERALGGQRC